MSERVKESRRLLSEVQRAGNGLSGGVERPLRGTWTTASRRWRGSSGRGSSRAEVADGPNVLREAASRLVERIGAVPTEVDGTVYVGGAATTCTRWM